MGVLDFLFEGSPPPSTTTYGTTVENMPQWLSDYTQALIARANMVAAEPYQAYQGPRVAGFSDDQTNAFDVIRNNIGNWNDEFDQAGDLMGGATGQGALTQSMPYFEQGAAGFDALTDPSRSSMGAAQPYLTAAGQTFPGAVSQYMDPYVGNVIDRAKLEANRNFSENLMPQISGRFIRGGQQGSTAHQDLLQRGARDVSEGLHSQSLAALSDAYKTAGTQFSTDAGRMADLAGTAGSLSASDRASQQATAAGLSGIGKDIGALNLGQASQQLAAGKGMSGLAALQQELGLKDAGAMEAIGQTQQQQVQKNFDTAYGDFQRQRDYPKEQTDWMSSIIRGMPHDTTSTTSSTGPANVYQPSPLSQLISMYGLYKDVTGKARGGIVHRPAPLSSEYGRYAEGGKVRSVTRLLQTLKGHHRSQDPQGVMDLLEDEGKKAGLPDLNRRYWQAEDTSTASAEIRRAVADLRKARGPGNYPKLQQPNRVKKAHGGLALAGY